ncbi:adenosine receptor A1-like [Stylophora pistillata]|uniref:adenosine receptor A1-like n=1 Tax=Stylophora pistillata TaxID=50429 RepID=UPI000C0463F5|nr:adenosine receptor A1-like [Stylophora pistillata]
MDFSTWNVFWSVTFTLIATMVTVGNLVAIVMFIKRKFLERFRFLLLSLAIADTFVGTLSVPLYIAVGIHPHEKLLVLVFQCLDIFTGMVSIFTLACISLVRMHAIVWPFRHRALKSYFQSCAIGFPWLLGLLGVSSRLLYHFEVVSRMMLSVMSNAFLLTPLLLITTSYILIWSKKPRGLPNEVQGDNQNNKLAKTLVIITATFLLTWCPHQITNLLFSFCMSCSQRPYAYTVVHVMKILQFSNSFINVIIYTLRFPEYRQTLSFCAF